MYAVVNLNINTRDIQETVMVNGQSCSFCSHKYRQLTACEQALHGVKKLGRRETVPFS